MREMNCIVTGARHLQEKVDLEFYGSISSWKNTLQPLPSCNFRVFKELVGFVWPSTVNEVVEMRHAPFCTNVCFVVPVTASIAIHVACGRSSKRSAKSFIFFYDRYRKDPLKPHLEGLGETDSNLQESLQRLARDPSKAKKSASETKSTMPVLELVPVPARDLTKVADDVLSCVSTTAASQPSPSSWMVEV